ncbi:hypothetical protein C8R43DRAFT_1136545 [Mycena crocata]|nr:hypothetical protein C8R43DRAFT_1136545 [Mycena crocata]
MPSLRALEGGGGRYPYPKHVWSPAGGWWSQPANWKMNTFIASCGMAFVCAFTIRAVAHREAELAGETISRRQNATELREIVYSGTLDFLQRLEAYKAQKAQKSSKDGSAKD